MTVQSIIRTAVNSMTANGLSYSFHCVNSDIQNVLADDVELPVVFLTRPYKIKPEITVSGHFRQIYYCTVLILFKDSFENTENQKNNIFEQSTLAQRELHILLENSQHVKNLTVDVCPEIEHLFDSDVSGIMMPFTFELKNTDSVCI